jgi:DNA-binding NarL/FixJ family response regulator
MTRQELCVLVAQHDPRVSQRIEEELAKAGLRVAGPVDDLDRALARPESQLVSAALVDLLLAEGADAVGRFRERHPGLPVIATAPRRFESRAKKAMAEGARLYLLDEELGRGLVAPVVAHVVRAADRDGTAVASADAARNMLHDLGNVLAVASGEAEMLLAKVKGTDPLAEDLRELNEVMAEGVRLFRQVAASRRVEATEPGPHAP